uniref:Uncharacterized protein n=1 Tax=Anguilla anguilla TaxID=7936 RepID=A0A0E9QZR4_ANGAN
MVLASLTLACKRASLELCLKNIVCVFSNTASTMAASTTHDSSSCPFLGESCLKECLFLKKWTYFIYCSTAPMNCTGSEQLS